MTDISKKFRLYYDLETGTPKYYTMEDLPGEFIWVDQQTYDSGRYDIKVVDGVIKSISNRVIKKYRMVDQKTQTSVSTSVQDISILVDEGSEHNLWDYISSN